MAKTTNDKRSKTTMETTTTSTTDASSVKPKKSSKKVVEEVPVDVPVVESSESSSGEATATPSTKRVAPTKESLSQEFDELVALLEEEVEKSRESSAKSNNVKFLRSLQKRLKTFRSHMARVLKQKRVSTVPRNPNSGFNKPIPVSKEMSKFCGWKVGELHSRAEVTKSLMNYVRAHGIQDENNKSKILVDKDPKFRTLLGYDGKKENEPIRFCDIQSRIKNHFPKVTAEPEAKPE